MNRELFLSIPEARFVLDEWRLEYNHRRPHCGLNWQTPAAYAAKMIDQPAGVFPAASRVASPVGANPRIARLSGRVSWSPSTTTVSHGW